MNLGLQATRIVACKTKKELATADNRHIVFGLMRVRGNYQIHKPIANKSNINELDTIVIGSKRKGFNDKDMKINKNRFLKINDNDNQSLISFSLKN